MFHGDVKKAWSRLEQYLDLTYANYENLHQYYGYSSETRTLWFDEWVGVSEGILDVAKPLKIGDIF